MSAEISVVPVAQRASKIEQAGKTSVSHRVPFRGDQRQLTVKVVIDDVLVYRLNNIRTIVQQANYLRSHDVAANFFSNGEENVTPQQIQHNFLVSLARANRRYIQRT